MGDPRDTTDEAYRHVPFNIDVEQALLGAFLQDNNAYWRAAEVLVPEHFYDPLHGRIFKVLAEQITKDVRVTPLSLHAMMKADPGVMETGGQVYFDALKNAAPAIPNIRDLSIILREMAVRRSIIRAAEIAIANAYEPPTDKTADQVAEAAAEALFDATQIAGKGEGAVPIHELVDRAVQTADRAMNLPASVVLSSGLYEVDLHLGGIYRGDLTVLGGAPNMGKTSLAQHIAEFNGRRAAANRDVGEVLFFSLEMAAEQIATRELAMRARVPSDRMRQGKITSQEAERLALAAREFPELPYRVDGDRRLSVAQIRARTMARKRRSKTGLSLVVIDHLRFVRPANPRDSEPEQIQQITRDLKDMATELNVAVLLVSHLNREAGKRDNKRPQLSDLYGSSAIEQNADAVWFIHREIYYLKRNEPSEKSSAEDKARHAIQVERHEGKAEIFAAKQRMGPIGRAEVRFEEQFTQFSDIEPPPTQAEIDLWNAVRGGG